MNSHGSTSIYGLVLALLATSASAAPSGITQPSPARTTTPAEELRARFEPRLERMRAGRVDETSRLTDSDRTALRAAQDRSAELLDMRGAGAGALLLVVAVVLLILVLI